jgi:hypothetical protein
MKPMKTLVLTLCCVVTASQASVQSAQTKPNIVLVLADNLGYRDLGCHGNRCFNRLRVTLQSLRPHDLTSSHPCFQVSGFDPRDG